MTNTNTGKIGRLPRNIREELNQRLDNGEPGSSILPWLNGLSEVRDILIKYFESRAISDQNLSEWRQGGFEKWQRRKDARFWLRGQMDIASEFLEETEQASVADCLSAPIAVILAELIERLGADAHINLEDRKGLLAYVRELIRLRSGDHQCQRLRLQSARATPSTTSSKTP